MSFHYNLLHTNKDDPFNIMSEGHTDREHVSRTYATVEVKFHAFSM